MPCNKYILLSAAALTLSACATTQPSMKAGQPHFGDAKKHNVAAQAIAPTAEQKETPFIPATAARRRLARDKYEKGEVTEPVPMTVNEDKK